ncbi:MAG: sugar ABC transporter ATP-binding protein [Actinobacteria bacterium]|nr:sugar ABC transporter ATP-binding protein [Actinomycetota bacterium]
MGSVSKTFPGQVALDGASLEVRPGRVHALVGQNGSGKSTLIKILAGYHHADEGGEATLLGEPLDLTSGTAAPRIHVMHQDLGLVSSLSAVENLALGRGFHTGAFGRVRWKAETARARTSLTSLGATFDPRMPVGELSPSERSIVALARALEGWDDDGGGLLILDEPTASMARPDVTRLFQAVRRFCERGAGVIFVSHRLDEVFEIADDYTVLRDGRVVGAGAVADLTHDSLIELIVGRALQEHVPGDDPEGGDPVLVATGLWGAQLAGLDLTVHAGETVGVAGLVGSGRDELPNLLFGAAARAAGTVTVRGKPVGGDPFSSVRVGLALVPAERKRFGSIGHQSIRENISLSRLRPLFIKGKLSRSAERQDVARWADRVELRPAEPERLFETLSGGNQQKAVIARWLRTEPAALVLDEPTQGVAVGSKNTIYGLLRDAAAGGLAVLVCSSEAEELAELCDRVIVLSGGRPVVELRGHQLTADSIVHWMLR